MSKHAGLTGRLVSSVIWNSIGQGGMALLTFLAVPYLVHRLGLEAYGIYILASVVIGYFSFLDLGLGISGVRYLAEYFARDEGEHCRAIFGTSLLMHFVLGAAGCALIAWLAPVLASGFFRVSRESVPVAVAAFRLAGAGFFVTMFSGALSAPLRAAGRFDEISRLQVLLGTLQIVAAVTLVTLGFSLVPVLLAAVGVQVCGILLFWERSVYYHPFLLRPRFEQACVGRLLKSGGFTTVSSLINPVLLNIDKLMMAVLWPVAYLTFYVIPFSFVDRLSVVRSSFSAILFPAFNFISGGKGSQSGAALHDRATAYLIFLYGLLAAFFIFFGDLFMGLWMGPEFAVRSGRILAILATAGFLSAVSSPALVALQGAEKPQWPALIHFFETLVFVPLAYFLIRYRGGEGAALAWLLRAFLEMLLLHAVALRVLEGSLWRWYAGLFKRTWAPVTLAGLCFWLIRLRGETLLNEVTILDLWGVSFIYFASIWLWGLDDFARAQLRAWVRQH